MKKCLDRRQHTRDRSRRLSLLFQIKDIGIQTCLCHFSEIKNSLLLQILLHLAQIPAIRHNGILRCSLHIFQIDGKFLQLCLNVHKYFPLSHKIPSTHLTLCKFFNSNSLIYINVFCTFSFVFDSLTLPRSHMTTRYHYSRSALQNQTILFSFSRSLPSIFP